MPYALNYCSDKKELGLLDNNMRMAIAFNSDDDWSIDSCNKLCDYVNACNKANGVDVCCFDITADNSIKAVEDFREQNESSMLVIISDATISPLLYMKPSVMASSLLLKPLVNDNVSYCMKEIVGSYYKKRNIPAESDENKFCVETKEGKTYYSFDKIVYFEAREKKIFLNTQHNEEGFYSTLDAIIDKLPDYFVKCHRSFIVNTRKIEKIQPSQNLICCEGEIFLPLSRGCKADVNKAMGVNKE